MAIKKIIFTIIVVLTSHFSEVKAQNFDEPVNVLGIRIDLKYCGEFEKISAIISSFSNVSIPITPGGFSVAQIFGTNPILEICNFLVQFRHLDTAQQIFRVADKANELSDFQFQKGIDFSKDLYDVSSVFITEDRKLRPTSELLTRSNSRRLNNFYRNQAPYVNEKLGTNLDSRSRERQQADLSRLAQITNRRSLVKSILKCPNPHQKPKDYAKIYDEGVLPAQRRMEDFEAYISFYRQSLLEMGSRFLPNESDFRPYSKLLNDIEASTYMYNIKFIKRDEVRIVSTPNNNRDPNDALQPRATEKEENVQQTYQSFCGNSVNVDNFRAACPLLYNGDNYAKFVQTYEKDWKNWTIMTASRTSRGLLNSPVSRVEGQFVDYSILCNRGEIRETIPRDSVDFNERFQQAIKQCESTTSQKIKDASSLFSFYSQQFIQNIRLHKALDSKIKTFESYYLGNVYTLNNKQEKDAASVYTSQEVSCSRQTNLGEIQSRNAELNSLNAEYNEMLVEMSLRENSRREFEKNEQKKYIQEEQRRRKMQRQRELARDREDSSTNMGLAPVDGI